MTKNSDIWMINIPILSTSCPYSGHMLSNMFPLISDYVKDKCHNPKNLKWIMWTYPECNKESCPLKVE